MSDYDAVIVGAGTAGIPAALFLARRGGRVALIEHAPEIGGCLLINRGQVSGAGTKLQREKGIHDTPELHYDDAMRINHGTSLPDFLRLSVALQGPFIDWLMDHGFEMTPDMPKILYGHEPYKVPRTYWGVEDGRSILKLLKPMLDAEIRAGKVDLKINTEVAELIQGGNGAVSGVRTAAGDEVRGGSTLLTTGGYAANPTLFAKLHDGIRLRSGAYPFAKGRGLELALKAGAELHLADYFMPVWAGFHDHTLPQPRYTGLGTLTPQDRTIWEIYVNDDGRRFIAEDHPHVHDREMALLSQPNQRAWVIYDQNIRQRAPNLFAKWAHLDMDRFYADSPSIHAGPSLAALAQACGVNGANLTDTVRRYNEACGTHDDALGRKIFPARIETPPFHAVEISIYSVRSYAGVKVNTDMQVLDKRAKPIPNLYAAGEIIGSVFSGRGAVGGMAVTPALVFGKLLGERILPLSTAR